MRTETTTPKFTAEIEQAEIDAWLDLYAATPADFAARFRPEILRAGEVVLTRCAAIPFVHFNCAMNLGVGTPATEERLDEVLALYAEAGVSAFALFHVPGAEPAELEGWLTARGLAPKGGWDRIVRDGAPLLEGVVEAASDLEVEEVTIESGPEWAAFLDSLYRLPTGPWLQALVGRPGWHHYALRREGKIVAVRTMYLGPSGFAWLGIEAPVPGLMAASFSLDQRLVERIVRDGLKLGAKGFVADIEAPHPEGKTPAYERFGALGFRRMYLRGHWRRG